MLLNLDPSGRSRAARGPAPAWRRLLGAAGVAVAAVAGGCSDDAPAPRVATAAGDPALGRELLARYQCGRCHQIPGVAGAQGRVAVTLESIGVRSYLAGRLPNTPEMQVRWIVDPASLVPGTLMPSMGASAAEARHMAAYLGTLR